MVNVHVYITLKEGVLDPQGKAVEHSLTALGYEGVEEVNVGKWIQLKVEDGEGLDARITAMCEQLLANPVIENYSYKVEREATV
ncbi:MULTISPECIES: phosphoribosylformylglycinamidine synthase subunit PurS [Geomicrobium]|uniref:Phosphoribosylformylglycinamidine synthase subunit PurS n=1 Tax=Geomicrobium sediminis TaxID=1347788 RepID=A0ABS2P9S1_9BACL|nr:MULTISPECIES: phosphoribosylformylglycinamidine synthase subunit PurS [Geomicrobium]MBM7632150.1 phosphoribosylformylglycinamidine synthase [Geomicrobium sediminis]GAJ98477.1 phosphoribosylformylglycinamidine synthase [Geomicrobium sp. JCM 19055]